jgi:LysM repeat protein
MKKIIACMAALLPIACSPLKSSPNDEKHQLELTLHELQTNFDDVRHDLNCFQTEMQILDGRIKYYENALSNLKQQDLEKQQSKIDLLSQQIAAFEKKIAVLEHTNNTGSQDLQQLTSHANETSAALAQFKNRIAELEQEIQSQNRRFEQIAKLKGHFEGLTKQLSSAASDKKIYKVRPGDTLEKIARFHQTTTERIKKVNDLKDDLIVVGQELIIPNDPTSR